METTYFTYAFAQWNIKNLSIVTSLSNETIIDETKRNETIRQIFLQSFLSKKEWIMVKKNVRLFVAVLPLVNIVGETNKTTPPSRNSSLEKNRIGYSK